MYKFVRDRQDGLEVDLDLDIEQNSTSKTTTATKTRSNARLSANNRTSSQTSNPYELQPPMYPIEKKEFDYDFVSKTC